MYGISLTSLKFFADPTISKFTSGRPSQNFDMIGMAFPRRFEIHINNAYSKRNALRQQQYEWRVYKDSKFEHELGKEFRFDNTITSESWLMYKTKAIFPQNRVYLKLTIINSQGLEMKEFYFVFTKGYQLSLDGRVYVVDPVSKKKVVLDGTLEELQRVEIPNPKTGKKIVKYVQKPKTLQAWRKKLTKKDQGKRYKIDVRVLDQINVHYSEEPRVVFTITPPHLESYAKVVLIMLNQMFNMQVAQAYMTNKNQKPDYATYNMLDEVGNLRSEGSGIPFLQTKESIGLGQGQYYSATSCIVKSYAA